MDGMTKETRELRQLAMREAKKVTAHMRLYATPGQLKAAQRTVADQIMSKARANA
jgi:hypothetical protein